MLTRMTRAALAATAVLAIAAPAAEAACADRTFSTVFADWDDWGLYAPIDNGDFEIGLDGWTVRGDASLVRDTPGRLASQTDDFWALELRPGSSATTPLICVGSGYPNARMFGHTTVPSPDSGSTLQVEVLYTEATRGGAAVKKLGSAPTEPRWDATRKMSLAQGQLNIKPDSNGNTYIQYRFTPLYKTTWRIDDVYIDPRLRG